MLISSQYSIGNIRCNKVCISAKHYKDAINRSYYASFYAIKAVLAMEKIDFKRHKDVMAYFNKTYGIITIFDKRT